MINIESYLICGDDFSREITALEAYMDSLQYDMAMESDTGSFDEPDGTRLRASYGKLSQAINSKDERKINEAKAEVANASAEVDQKVKDPERKKKIIRIAIAAASAAALTVGAIVVANDLKKGDASKLRGAADVMKMSVTDMIHGRKNINKKDGSSYSIQEFKEIIKGKLDKFKPGSHVAVITDPKLLNYIKLPTDSIAIAAVDPEGNIMKHQKIEYLSKTKVNSDLLKLIGKIVKDEGLVLVRK